MVFKTKTEEQSGTNVARIDEAVPLHIRAAMEQAEGRGVSTAQEDNLIPLVYILQPLSPQLDAGSPAFIEGAQPGDIWLRSHPEPIVRGQEGMEFIHCAWSKDTVEWVPRKAGGGFIARHNCEPKDVPGAYVDPQDKNRWLRKVATDDGGAVIHELMETRYHYGFANGQPAVLTFTSTGHTVSRDWMAKMNAIRVGDKKPDAWFKRWRLKTMRKQNPKGTWYVFTPSDGGWTPEALLQQCAQLHKDIVDGLRRAAEPDQPEAAGNAEAAEKAGI